VITQIVNKKTKEKNILESVISAARIADERKAESIKVLDMRKRLIITDYFLIISARNPRLSRRIYEDIDSSLKKKGIKAITVSGANEGNWILADYDDFVIHIFTTEFAEYYDLERLWMDSDTIDWQS